MNPWIGGLFYWENSQQAGPLASWGWRTKSVRTRYKVGLLRSWPVAHLVRWHKIGLRES